jgi:hypothetical protein
MQTPVRVDNSFSEHVDEHRSVIAITENVAAFVPATCDVPESAFALDPQCSWHMSLAAEGGTT